MDALIAPLRRLNEDFSWFIRNRDVRLLHVIASGDLHAPVAKLSGLQEHRPENASPFIVLEDSFSPKDEGWSARTERARATHAARREAMQKKGYSLPALPPPPTSGEPFGRFALTIGEIYAARCPPLDGLVVVLAPAQLEGPDEWGSRIAMLYNSPPLRQVRWVVVDIDRSTIDAVQQAAGPAYLRSECKSDKEAENREVGDMLACIANAPADAPGPAQGGAAWPRSIKPPPRVGQPIPDAASVAATQKVLGPHGALIGEGGAFVRKSIFGAALAMRENRGSEAVALQAEAKDHCLRAGLVREGTILEMVLAGYQLQSGQSRAALETYRQAAVRSEGAGLAQEAVQAHLAMGAIYLVGRDHVRAGTEYSHAGRLAEGAGLSFLAIEAFRMAGQVAADAGAERSAADQWRKALQIAEAAPPTEAKMSSAAETARKLAALYRSQGLAAQADSLMAQADAFERAELTPLAAHQVTAQEA